MSPRTPEQIVEVKKEKRLLIEEAALEVFAEDGYHHASVSKIATKAGVSKGLMYTYFESKEELLKELIRDVMKDVMDRFSFGEAAELTDELVIDFIKKSIRLVQEDPQRWKLFFGMFLQKQVMDIMMEEMMEMSSQYLQPFIKYYQNKGEKDPMSVVRYLHATIDGVQMQLMMDPDNFPVKQVELLIIKQFVK